MMLSDIKEQMSFITAAELPIIQSATGSHQTLFTLAANKVRNVRIYMRNMPAIEYRSPAQINDFN